MPSDNCSLARLLIGWLTDLENRRDIRVSKSSVRALAQVRTRETAQRQRLAVADLSIATEPLYTSKR